MCGEWLLGLAHQLELITVTAGSCHTGLLPVDSSHTRRAPAASKREARLFGGGGQRAQPLASRLQFFFCGRRGGANALGMSQIEETLSRISKMGGVEGYVITDGEGAVVRQSKSFSDEVAASYATEVNKLTKRARHLVRDLDPKVRAPARHAASGVFLPQAGAFSHPVPTLTSHFIFVHHARCRMTSSSFACERGGAGKFWQRRGKTALSLWCRCGEPPARRQRRWQRQRQRANWRAAINGVWGGGLKK